MGETSLESSVFSLEPEGILEIIKKVESAGGRDRSEKWGPRTIDIDILLYGSRVYESESLCVPHPGLLKRAFALVPLLELNPQLCLPDGTELKCHLNDPEVASQQIRRVEIDELFL